MEEGLNRGTQGVVEGLNRGTQGVEKVLNKGTQGVEEGTDNDKTLGIHST